MTTSRKQFLQQSAFAFAGTCLPFSKLFAKEANTKVVLDTYHPVDCSIDLATSYKYVYDPNDPGNPLNTIAVLDGYYSYPDTASGNTVNPFSNDVQYAAEDVSACSTNISTDQCIM